MGIESQNLAAWYEGGCKFRVKHWYELGADADTDAGAGWAQRPRNAHPRKGQRFLVRRRRSLSFDTHAALTL